MSEKKSDMERVLEAMDRFREGDEHAFDGMTILLDADDKTKVLEEDK